MDKMDEDKRYFALYSVIFGLIGQKIDSVQ